MDDRVGSLAGGATLISFSSFSPAKRFAVLDALTPTCSWDRAFGRGGTTTITVPASLRALVPQERDSEGQVIGSEGLVIDSLVARSDGGAILAGRYKGTWLVGEVTASGQLDRAFGDGGWSALPFDGTVTKVLQEPSGRILLAGQEHESGCCTMNWAAAVSASGQLERSFGTGGHAALPTDESSGIHELLREPDGNILIAVGGGNMGCWRERLALLTPSGQPVPGFAALDGTLPGQRSGRFWHRLGMEAFIGDTYLEGDGFTVVGTGERPCDEERPGLVAPSTGVLAHFRANGTLARAVIRFPSPMYGTVEAAPGGRDVVLAEDPVRKPADLTLSALRANGSLNRHFGDDGRVLIHAPQSQSRPGPSIERVSDGQIALFDESQASNVLQLLLLRP